jgi:penicillin-binding protein 2
MNVWTNVIANGGELCQPHLAGSGTCENLGISKKTISLIKQGMVEACSPGGTAYPLFNFKVPLACKTRTAEFGDPENHTHAWLTAFAPSNKPELSVTVLVEAAGEGSDVAAPIVKKILESYFEKK